MSLWRFLFGRSDDLGVVEHWSEKRAEDFERKTYRYLGIRPEPTFTWSRKFRPKGKSNVMRMAERKVG